MILKHLSERADLRSGLGDYFEIILMISQMKSDI